ncbi:IS4 family transposase [Deferrisoma camini]|uniref:IS4 family transposase n=1 Tax=Deferrisoma camini TaxID=1035120 RepID=UPI00046D259C|nr:IS4 family transposase [Deferrisoma camini]
MARTPAGLPEGTRITDYITLGVIAKTFPLPKVHEVLQATGKASQRQRALPAHVVVYYVIALALYMSVSTREVLRCLLEGLQWLMGPRERVRVAGKSAISQARSRLGAEPIERLHNELVRPIAETATRGAWYRRWRLVSLDGSTLDVADTQENEQAFGRPKAARGRSAYPQIRFVSLVENGTHVLFGSRMGGYHTSEVALARHVVESLRPGMLCLADRCFFSWPLWTQACATGADLLWRVKASARLPCIRRLSDGSYLSKIYPNAYARQKDRGGVMVRVIEYTLDGVPGAEDVYRLVTTILDPEDAPAEELAALYQERWEIETALDELKTHLRGARIVLRSKTPELVRQEFFGFLMAHFAIRGLMHEAARKGDVDPDELSFVHTVRVVRRRLPAFVATPP